MSGPRILIWDIETSPSLGWVWQKYETDVLAFESQWYLLSIAWKWLDEKQVHVKGLCDFDRYKNEPENDYDLAALAHELFCEADIVIAHNGIAFDTRKAQARMIIHGFDPPTPFREIDTLKVARSRFAFTSNKLGDLCDVLGIGRKLETGGFQTWLGCINGDANAWSKMKRYNKNDVIILEKLYTKLRPWINGHPNVSMFTDNLDCCPKCGADTMMKRGFGRNRTSTFQRWQCTSCGGWSSSRISEKTAKPSLVN